MYVLLVIVLLTCNMLLLAESHWTLGIIRFYIKTTYAHHLHVYLFLFIFPSSKKRASFRLLYLAKTPQTQVFSAGIDQSLTVVLACPLVSLWTGHFAAGLPASLAHL